MFAHSRSALNPTEKTNKPEKKKNAILLHLTCDTAAVTSYRELIKKHFVDVFRHYFHDWSVSKIYNPAFTYREDTAQDSHFPWAFLCENSLCGTLYSTIYLFIFFSNATKRGTSNSLTESASLKAEPFIFHSGPYRSITRIFSLRTWCSFSSMLCCCTSSAFTALGSC